MLVAYTVLFPTVELANNFVVVIKKPAVVFAASAVAVFRSTTVVTTTVSVPGACGWRVPCAVARSHGC